MSSIQHLQGQRGRDEEVQMRSPKRRKIGEDMTADDPVSSGLHPASQGGVIFPSSSASGNPSDVVLPQSHALLGTIPFYAPDGSLKLMERDVGISEFIGYDVPCIEGIIKQRFTDFLVFEVDLDGNVVHVKSLGPPETVRKEDETQVVDTPLLGSCMGPHDTPDPSLVCLDDLGGTAPESVLVPPVVASHEPWPERFDTALAQYLPDEIIKEIRGLFLEGSEPPFVSDDGWSGCLNKQTSQVATGGAASAHGTIPQDSHKVASTSGNQRKEKHRQGRSSGGRPRRAQREDNRKVLTDPIASKATRASLHQMIRELFGGKLETETDAAPQNDDEGSRIVIRWARAGGRGGRVGPGRGASGRSERQSYPPYIHFTMQKTNRDTQDALAHLSRSLHCNVKDLSVAGTKDKRGVTVQRVSFKRGNKLIEDVWKMANGIGSRRTAQEAVSQRGERGIRVTDFKYSRASLELGMLKGNAFVITLRNAQVDSLSTLDRAMSTIKGKGFINYYGMQRFGTASIPTHSIGLALLRSDWQHAVSLILRKRPGEHPDVEAARHAWLADGDLEKALELMPRRVVAERCILESFKKQGGDTRNAMGALSTIPRNLRLMYVHAYQSYVWNAVVSERIRTHGADRPVAGDLVLDKNPVPDVPDADMYDSTLEINTNEEEMAKPDNNNVESSDKWSRRPWEPPKVKVKTLTEADLEDYTIFDVIMPLPGKDVAFPGGTLGERYKEFLRADGLDPDNFERKQKEYTLGGSYRKILHLPRELTWAVLGYTDPDVALAQADEDKLLGFDPPIIVENGKFIALQICLQLGSAAYATMALREVTKTETSSHFQTTLTQASEDQKYKASGEAGTKPRGS